MTTLDGITVTLRLFAVYRERVGSDCIEVTLPNGATVDDALKCLAEAHPATVPLLPTTMVAVNQEYVERSHLLQAMDEVALIPPVSGGMDYPSPNPRILITDEPLDAEEVTAMVMSTANGGVVTFQGITRDQTGGRTVELLEYEAYPEMAYRMLQQIFDEVEERWGVTDLALVAPHRAAGTGRGEPHRCGCGGAPSGGLRSHHVRCGPPEGDRAHLEEGVLRGRLRVGRPRLLRPACRLDGGRSASGLGARGSLIALTTRRWDERIP